MALSQTENLSSATQKQFEVLRQRFATGLTDRWRDISQAADMPSLEVHLHRLCGSAGSFGFERLGQLARQAELLCAAGDRVALTECLSRIDIEIRAAKQVMSFPTTP